LLWNALAGVVVIGFFVWLTWSTQIEVARKSAARSHESQDQVAWFLRDWANGYGRHQTPSSWRTLAEDFGRWLKEEGLPAGGAKTFCWDSRALCGKTPPGRGQLKAFLDFADQFAAAPDALELRAGGGNDDDGWPAYCQWAKRYRGHRLSQEQFQRCVTGWAHQLRRRIAHDPS
jgi:hypothetical protein